MWLQVVATSATATAAVSGIVWRAVVLPLRRIAVKQEEFRRDWDGTPARPGVPERQGVMPRLAGIEAGQSALADRVGRVEHELRPNGGGSMRDVVDRVEHELRLTDGSSLRAAVDRVEQATRTDQPPDLSK